MLHVVSVSSHKIV
uniref:Uncharacterized protein n=1 Tax=Anguilla anguilla TaxID=7936 RepID=A0A0E9SGA1_ANGAN